MEEGYHYFPIAATASTEPPLRQFVGSFLHPLARSLSVGRETTAPAGIDETAPIKQMGSVPPNVIVNLVFLFPGKKQ